jgi:hypothetical protein
MHISALLRGAFQWEDTDMDKSSSNEDTGTEMLAEEEDLWWDLHPFNLFGYDRKATTPN